MSRTKLLGKTNNNLDNYVINQTANSSVGPPAISMSIADSGATLHFVTIDAPTINCKVTNNLLAITTAIDELMYSTHMAGLNIPYLPSAARHCHVMPKLGQFSLVSIGQLCNADREVLFQREIVTVSYKNDVIMKGRRMQSTGLWHLDLNHHDGHETFSPVPRRSICETIAKGESFSNLPPVPRYTNNIPAGTEPPTGLTAIGTARPADVVAFHHAALFSPTLSTLELALPKGFLPPLPGLTLQALHCHPPHSVATIKGHLDRIRKNLRSTKKVPKESPTTPVSNTDKVDDWFSASEPFNKRSHHFYVGFIKPERLGQIYSDLTGRFPIASSKENNYLLIIYDYDSNGILAQPMQTCTGPCIQAAYKVLHECLVAAGLRPQLQQLDNEASQSLKQFMTTEGIDYQLVPPGVHCQNAAKQAICTFKNHFIAGLCSTDKNFHLHLWNQLVPQAKLTLNMIQGSQLNPKISAHTQLNGHFDVN
jgi:hypothetical protein